MPGTLRFCDRLLGVRALSPTTELRACYYRLLTDKTLRFTYPILLCVCMLLAACNREPHNAVLSPRLKIESLDPNFTVAGKAFNVQPDGQAALAVVGSQIPIGSIAFWNDQPLKTGGGGQQGWGGAALP